MSDTAEALASKFRRLVELRETRDQTKVTAENAEQDYREYEADLFDEMRDGPIKGSLRLDLGEPYGTITFSPRETFFGRIIDADQALEHFENRAMVDEMTRVKISKGKLNEIVRDLVEQGKPMPPGVDFYPQRGITITRRKGS